MCSSCFKARTDCKVHWQCWSSLGPSYCSRHRKAHHHSWYELTQRNANTDWVLNSHFKFWYRSPHLIGCPFCYCWGFYLPCHAVALRTLSAFCIVPFPSVPLRFVTMRSLSCLSSSGFLPQSCLGYQCPFLAFAIAFCFCLLSCHSPAPPFYLLLVFYHTRKIFCFSKCFLNWIWNCKLSKHFLNWY